VVRVAPGLLVLTLATVAHAQSPVVEIRVAGTHTIASGDTPASALQLALADANGKAWQAAASRLRSRADIKALRLQPAQLDAGIAGILDIEPVPAAPAAAARQATVQVAATAQVTLRLRLNAGDAARRIAALRKDQDASLDVTNAWSQIQQLQARLADQTQRDPRGTTAAALNLKYLAARAYGALARTEPTTVGGRLPSAEGLERARQLAEAAAAISADAPDAHYVFGDLWVEDEKPGPAEAEYRIALAAEPGSALGRTKLAAALRYQDKLPEAIAELRHVLRTDPGFARAHSDLGMILRAQKQLPESIAAYREAIRLDPDLIDAHNGLAVALANNRDLEAAVVEFREIVRIDPDSTIGYYNLAYALADLDRDVESAIALREVIRINPNHYNARFNLGELLRLEGKYDDSARQFREFLRLAPDTPQTRRNISRARQYVEQFEDTP
jgi:tetratricopeptide (TPR) repeat protein